MSTDRDTEPVDRDDDFDLAAFVAARGRQTKTIAPQTLPTPREPMRVARTLACQYPEPITWWQGEFYSHTGTRWEVADQDAVESWLWRVLENATYLHKDKEDNEQVMAWAPTTLRVRDVSRALSRGALHRSGGHDRVTATRSGVVRRKGKERNLVPHSPDVFNLSSLPFAYDATATAPLWGKFLDEVLPNAPMDQAFLQEWFGYLLTGRTNIHKMAVLAGESRSGKGTILRIMRALLGEENTAAGRLDDIVEQFGMEPLIGKTLLTFGDVRWNNSNVQGAIQRLLEISGEDAQTVPRKGKMAWHGTLGTRIVFAGNDVPRFNDPSHAMANRMHIVRFGQSFAGREDWGLTDRLLAELPGIFNWALDGLDRLEDSGSFSVSESTLLLKERVGESSDRLGQFIDEYLELGEGLTATEDGLMEAYEEWTKRTRNNRDSTSAAGLRDLLMDRFPGVENNKGTRLSVRVNGKPRKVRAFLGLGLKCSEDRLVNGMKDGWEDDDGANF